MTHLDISHSVLKMTRRQSPFERVHSVEMAECSFELCKSFTKSDTKFFTLVRWTKPGYALSTMTSRMFHIVAKKSKPPYSCLIHTKIFSQLVHHVVTLPGTSYPHYSRHCNVPDCFYDPDYVPYVPPPYPLTKRALDVVSYWTAGNPPNDTWICVLEKSYCLFWLLMRIKIF